MIKSDKVIEKKLCGKRKVKASTPRDDMWTLQEDKKLAKAVELYTDPTRLKRKRIDWEAVSKYMEETRTSKQCYSRWTTTAMHNLDGRKVGPWDSEDDAKLIEEVERQKRENNMKVSWQAVSDNVNLMRNRKQCMARYNNVLQFNSNSTKKVGAWDASEDTKLIEAVEMFRGKGRKNGISWGDVVKQMNYTRSQKQCKKRWDDAFAEVYKNRIANSADSKKKVDKLSETSSLATSGSSSSMLSDFSSHNDLNNSKRRNGYNNGANSSTNWLDHDHALAAGTLLNLRKSNK